MAEPPTKKARDGQEQSAEDQKDASTVLSKSSFETGTTEAAWTSETEGTQYILRHLHGETCCYSPYEGVKDWPVLRYTRTEEGEPDYNYVLDVIGGVWVKDTHQFVAFWGADRGDSHVEFYCRDDYKGAGELESLTKDLCCEICPPLIDTFDDGSGDSRDVTLIPAASFDNELLNNLYQKKE